jgi:hypothetical protein
MATNYLLSLKQAVEHSGLSEDFLRRGVREGRIPALNLALGSSRPNGRPTYKIWLSDLDAFMSSMAMAKPAPSPASKAHQAPPRTARNTARSRPARAGSTARPGQSARDVARRAAAKRREVAA